MEINERICRAILRRAWEDAGGECEMPEFPSNVSQGFTIGGAGHPLVVPESIDKTFYREYLRKAIDAAPWDWQE